MAALFLHDITFQSHLNGGDPLNLALSHILLIPVPGVPYLHSPDFKGGWIGASLVCFYLCHTAEQWTVRNTRGIPHKSYRRRLNSVQLWSYTILVLQLHPWKFLLRESHVRLTCWGVCTVPSCLWNGISCPLPPDLELELRYALEPFIVEWSKHHKKASYRISTAQWI